MATVHIDDHPHWLIRLIKPGNIPDESVLPLVEVPEELFRNHVNLMYELAYVQGKLRAIYNAEIQARQEEQMRRQKSAPTAVVPSVETERKR